MHPVSGRGSELERSAFDAGYEIERQSRTARAVEALVELGIGVTGVIVERHDTAHARSRREGEQIAPGSSKRRPRTAAAAVFEEHEIATRIHSTIGIVS